MADVAPPVDDRGVAGFTARLPLYLGGFMGPFGTIVIVPMFPELRDEFDVSAGAAALGLSLYLVPFAILLLVSGTLGERWGRRRTVRTTYLLYALASIAAAMAPNFGVFILARAVQGVANAFITPLLLAGLADTVQPSRLGRQVGIYSSFQAFGSGMGPVIGGLAADTDWRYAFFGSAVVAALLALTPPAGEPRPSTDAPRLRHLVSRELVLLGIAFFFSAFGPVGIGVIVGVVGRDALDLSGTATGLVLLAGSVAAMGLATTWGRLLDRFGTRRAALVAMSVAIPITVLPAAAVGAWSLGVLWVVAQAVLASNLVIFQSVGASVLPDNRGGGLSFILAFRFVGHAVGPVVLIPLVDWSVVGTYAVGAALGVPTVLALAWLTRELER